MGSIPGGCIFLQTFNDADLEEASLEKIQFVATMAPSTALGRHAISKR